jgi:AcrR family transcriptional regulator
MALAPETRQARIDEILDAAERLIRGEGGTQFSMRALAAEAGVSQATPFNLLGSKAAILRGLIERSTIPPAAPRWEKEPIQLIFQICTLITERFARDADYYRALMSGIGSAPEAALAAMAKWQQVLQHTATSGALAEDTDVRLLAENLELLLIGTLALWTSGDLPSERLTAQYRHGVATCLLGAATDRSRARILKHLRAATRALRALGPLGG